MKKRIMPYSVAFSVIALLITALDWARVVWHLPYAVHNFVQIINIPYDGLLHITGIVFGVSGASRTLFQVFVQNHLLYYLGYIISYALYGALLGFIVSKVKEIKHK